MSSVPSFAEFFEAVHGHAPFPWQENLAAQVLESGWPSLLDLPTGSGKTSALDVALFAWAVEPLKMPRRVLLVVDRRIVVDQGAEHARRLLGALKEGAHPATRSVAQRLRENWGAAPDEDPFAIAVLRGGMPRDNDWARRPDQPVLGVSTVDQVGSRLLFRGYGVGPLSAPLHAGLLGHDTLILLDEVHLAQPFAETLDAIGERFRRPGPLPERFQVVRMSATPGVALSLGHFQLTEADRAHPVLSPRLEAHKRARLLEVAVRGEERARKEALARRAVQEALRLQREGAPVVAVVVNRVETARLAAQHLKEAHPQARSLLVTGRMRPLDRDRLVEQTLLPLAAAGRDRAQATPLIVISTQSIEAGADLDFDALVTECASVDALRQRFGRLDRRGELGESRALILMRSDLEKERDPIYGDALAQTWRWLQREAVEGEIDFGVAHLPSPVDVSGRPRADLLAPSLSAPVLLPAQLDAWAQTSEPPVHDPDVSLWLHGPERDVAEVQIVWRPEVEAAFIESDRGMADGGAEKKTRLACEDRIHALLSAARPSSLEALSLPLSVARAWLRAEEGGEEAPLADVVGPRAPEERARERRAPGRRAYRWSGSRERSGFVRAAEIRPGDVLVVPTIRGGLSDGNFDPAAGTPVEDLSAAAQFYGRGVASLVLRQGALAEIREELGAAADPSEDTAQELRLYLARWLEGWPTQVPAGFGAEIDWPSFKETLLRRAPQRIDGWIVLSAPLKREKRAFTPLLGESITEDEDSSFRSGQLSLAQHSDDVRAVVRRFAQALGFAPELIEDLALAAWFHDVGKADPRFQRWLVGGDEIETALLDEPLAKSALPPGRRDERERARLRAGYPAGYRHELLSLHLLEQSEAALAQANDPELVRHLVASHHGWCRPFAPIAEEGVEEAVSLRHGDHVFNADTGHSLARLDSGVSDRFWALNERYGWWGLAWLEAVLRLADHRASESRETA